MSMFTGPTSSGLTKAYYTTSIDAPTKVRGLLGDKHRNPTVSDATAGKRAARASLHAGGAVRLLRYGDARYLPFARRVPDPKRGCPRPVHPRPGTRTAQRQAPGRRRPSGLRAAHGQ